MQFSSLKAGDIDVAHEIMNLEFQFRRLQAILDWIVQNNEVTAPSDEMIAEIEDRVLRFLNEKYPSAKLGKKLDENALLYERELIIQDTITAGTHHGIDLEAEFSSPAGDLVVEGGKELPEETKTRIREIASRIDADVVFK